MRIISVFFVGFLTSLPLFAQSSPEALQEALSLDKSSVNHFKKAESKVEGKYTDALKSVAEMYEAFLTDLDEKKVFAFPDDKVASPDKKATDLFVSYVLMQDAKYAMDSYSKQFLNGDVNIAIIAALLKDKIIVRKSGNSMSISTGELTLEYLSSTLWNFNKLVQEKFSGLTDEGFKTKMKTAVRALYKGWGLPDNYIDNVLSSKTGFSEEKIQDTAYTISQLNLAQFFRFKEPFATTYKGDMYTFYTSFLEGLDAKTTFVDSETTLGDNQKKVTDLYLAYFMIKNANVLDANELNDLGNDVKMVILVTLFKDYVTVQQEGSNIRVQTSNIPMQTMSYIFFTFYNAVIDQSFLKDDTFLTKLKADIKAVFMTIGYSSSFIDSILSEQSDSSFGAIFGQFKPGQSKSSQWSSSSSFTGDTAQKQLTQKTDQQTTSDKLTAFNLMSSTVTFLKNAQKTAETKYTGDQKVLYDFFIAFLNGLDNKTTFVVDKKDMTGNQRTVSDLLLALYLAQKSGAPSDQMAEMNIKLVIVTTLFKNNAQVTQQGGGLNVSFSNLTQPLMNTTLLTFFINVTQPYENLVNKEDIRQFIVNIFVTTGMNQQMVTDAMKPGGGSGDDKESDGPKNQQTPQETKKSSTPEAFTAYNLLRTTVTFLSNAQKTVETKYTGDQKTLYDFFVEFLNGLDHKTTFVKSGTEPKGNQKRVSDLGLVYFLLDKAGVKFDPNTAMNLKIVILSTLFKDNVEVTQSGPNISVNFKDLNLPEFEATVQKFYNDILKDRDTLVNKDDVKAFIVKIFGEMGFPQPVVENALKPKEEGAVSTETADDKSGQVLEEDTADLTAKSEVDS